MIRAALVVVALGATASADPITADDHKRRASEAYEKHHYIGARLELLAAIAEEPSAEFWFALGQNDYNLGLYDEAIDAWKRFLDTKPPEDDAARAEQAIGAANAKVHAPRYKVPEPRPEYGRRWDALDTTLVVVGVAAIGTGAAGVYHARTLGDDQSGTVHDYDRRLHTAREYQTGGFAIAAAGAVAIVGAVWRWRVHFEELPSLVISATSTGATVWLGGSL